MNTTKTEENSQKHQISQTNKKKSHKKSKSKIHQNGNFTEIDEVSDKLKSVQVCENGISEEGKNGQHKETSDDSKSKNSQEKNQSANKNEIAKHKTNHEKCPPHVQEAGESTESIESKSGSNQNHATNSSSSNENSDVSTEISEISIATQEKCLYVYKTDNLIETAPSTSSAGPQPFSVSPQSTQISGEKVNLLMETIKQQESNATSGQSHHQENPSEDMMRQDDQKADDKDSSLNGSDQFGGFEEEKVLVYNNAGADNEIVEKVRDNVTIQIRYKVYESELEMPDIMRLIQKDLSEPYSVYTYRYFIHNWPKLCFLALHEKKCVGAIVCKLDLHRQTIKRGYIAMLAVDKDYRKLKIGSTLVQKAIRVCCLLHPFIQKLFIFLLNVSGHAGQ